MVPLLRWYYEMLRIPDAPPATLRFLRLAVPCCAFSFRLLSRGRAPHSDAGLVIPVSPSGLKSWKRRASQVPGWTSIWMRPALRPR